MGFFEFITIVVVVESTADEIAEYYLAHYYEPAMAHAAQVSR